MSLSGRLRTMQLGDLLFLLAQLLEAPHRAANVGSALERETAQRRPAADLLDRRRVLRGIRQLGQEEAESVRRVVPVENEDERVPRPRLGPLASAL